jgi:hypothetical protein
MAKSKFERTKPHANIGTIGHIDHGKTTLTAAITNVLHKHNPDVSFTPFDQIDKAPSDSNSGTETPILLNGLSARFNDEIVKSEVGILNPSILLVMEAALSSSSPGNVSVFSFSVV